MGDVFEIKHLPFYVLNVYNNSNCYFINKDRHVIYLGGNFYVSISKRNASDLTITTLSFFLFIFSGKTRISA